MVQRRAAQWVTSNYDWRSGISITSTLEDLQWQSLLQRRQISRLFHKAAHHASGLKILGYYDQKTLVESTISYHRLHFSIPFINTNSYRFSYFPIIDEWNHLPHHLLEPGGRT